MKQGKKIEAKLRERIAGFEKAKSGKHETKVAQRYETGGYHMPGSRSKKTR